MSDDHHSSEAQFQDLYLQAIRLPKPARRHCVPQAVQFKKCLHTIAPGMMSTVNMQRIKCQNQAELYGHCMKKINQKQSANHLIAAYMQNPAYFNKQDIAPGLHNVVSIIFPITSKGGPTSFKFV